MKENDITKLLVSKRVKQQGWDFKTAITTPKMNRGRIRNNDAKHSRLPFKRNEVIEIIGRVKYMNNHYKKYQSAPITIPEGVLIRAKEYKIDIEKVKEAKV